MLRFCFGASGAGKSTGLYEEIIKRSIKEPGKNYLIIVPDQFTMQTQKDVVRLHPSHAIMNIDVLSFGRLSHRIFEETGHGSFSVLDDVGKSLVLMRVADMLGDRLPIIGRNMHKPGYIDEVKSTISEFMQYGISDKELALLEEKSCKKGALTAKLGDLRLIYSEFLSYIQDKYITTEETLDILCSALAESDLIKDSVVVFDGFTGFTPIQYRVIKKLLMLCSEVMFSVTIDPKVDPYSDYKEQELFMLSKKTVRDLEKLEYQVNTERGASVPDFETFRNMRHSEMANKAEGGDIFIADEGVKRLEHNEALKYLEKTLFRYGNKPFDGENGSISLYQAQTPTEEIRQTMIKISDLVREHGYAYRDFAIVCGSLDAYSDIVARQAEIFDIPVYVDKNVDVLFNPFLEYVTSALGIVISGYKYEDVFHYIRSGMTDFDRKDADLLDDYVRALGIRSQKQWEDRFSRHMPKKFRPRKKDESGQERELLEMQKLEAMREHISSDLKPLFDAKKGSVRDISAALLKVIEDNNCAGKLAAYKDMFEERGDGKKAKEYQQIYDKVIGLIKQIDDLIGSDTMDLMQYRDILVTGLGDIKVGTIPQDVDRIIVGDIERTRLKEIRVLFFVGVNDGSIPSNVGGGGILSDIDRQFLTDLDTGIELAPTPRQQMYIQRLYLYMNLTKPTDRLFLSYAELGNDGKSQRPAYLIPKIKDMYPGINVERPQDGSFVSQTVNPKDSMNVLSGMLRDYAAGRAAGENGKLLMTLVEAMGGENNETIKKMTDAAFMHYESKPLAKAVALALYSANFENSVSRLEKFAGCCYSHFIKYGLHIDERQEYKFEYADLGNVFHEVLEEYTGYLITNDIDWKDLSQQESDEILNRALTKCFDSYGETILRSSARNEFISERIKRILARTVSTLQYQISKGSFKPAFVEMGFSEAGKIDEIDITLSEDEKQGITERMKLHGKIDRVDLCEDEDNVYVKVIDYKSGSKKINIASLYYGLQLQLVMYMNVAMAAEKKISGGKNVVPAAILYYHVDDPMIDGSEGMQPDVINDAIRKELKMTGLVNDNPDVIKLLDGDFTRKSDVIPVEYKTDGSFTAASKVASSEDYRKISEFVNGRIREFGKRILDGDIQVNPYEMGQSNSCKYCSYRSVCGFDEKIPGYRKRTLDIKEAEALEKILNGD
ncbi:MAG: PD-(D/E)XK nuclease family protein [Butyrivibrio sp.]|nr:PD-(D/E)XK nuclease family protein [Butyrivibrio sp.]